ncbi:MAG: hypothetical protein KC731_30220, partial [Myxococcales bacterium]|nr:hypothetical protein [Myxococcales bacterium]
MGSITEQCSVCHSSFDVTFRYQMEEREGGFVFFCSQDCLGRSQAAADDAEERATCDACAKRFTVTLASEVVYTEGRRRYACSMPCRKQLVAEAEGLRLGDIATAEPVAEPVAAPTPITAA